MRTNGKILKKVLLAIVIVVVLVVLILKSVGNKLLAVGIETGMTKALNVGTEIDSVDLSLFAGAVNISGLVINNPPGYKIREMMEIGEVDVAVNIGSLLSDTVEIKHIRLDGAMLAIEQKGLSNNLKDVIDAIDTGEKEPEKEEVEKEEEKPAKNLRIETLEITNTKVKVKLLPLPGKADVVELELGPIVMENLGSDDKLTVGVLASKILVAIAEGVAKQGGKLLPEDLVGSIEDALKGEIASKLFEGVEGAGKGIEEGVKGITEGLKGLLEKK